MFLPEDKQILPEVFHIVLRLAAKLDIDRNSHKSAEYRHIQKTAQMFLARLGKSNQPLPVGRLKFPGRRVDYFWELVW